MSPGVIVSLIAAGIILMVVAAVVAQNLENARQERHRAVLALQERTRTIWDIIGGLPPEYLPAEQRQLLLNYLCSCYRTMMTLEPRQQTTQASAQLKNVEELLAQPYSSKAANPEPAFKDHLTGQALRSRVKAMVELFVIIHQEGKLDRQQAQQCINQGKALFELINIDLNLITAREIEKSDNPKLALAHYSSSLKRLQRLNKKGQLTQRISNLQGKIGELKSTLGVQATEDKQQEKLNQEWAEFDDESDWKMKQDYD